MKFLLLGLNYAPEPTGIAVYSADLARGLAARGHQVSFVTAHPYYPHWQVFDGYEGKRWTLEEDAGVTLRRCPLYVPPTPSTARRMVHYASFAASAGLPFLRQARAFDPDIVWTVAPSLVSAPLALLAGRLADAPTCLHIQDFEVEAAFATGRMSGGSRAGRLGLSFERSILKRFDLISSISPEMCAKLEDKGCAAGSIYELRNWADIKSIVPDMASDFRSRWGITTKHVALYSGALGEKQGLDTILETARLLDGNADVTFVVCGNGPSRAALEERASGQRNIQFHDLQPKEDLGALLSMASIHLLPQKAEAADLVLPSKLTNMLASGRPVVAGVAHGRGLAREVEGCGLVVPPEDAAAMAQAIQKLCDAPELMAELGANARKRAEEVWDKDAIIDRYVARLEALVDA